jgi:hypothetical protein
VYSKANPALPDFVPHAANLSVGRGNVTQVIPGKTWKEVYNVYKHIFRTRGFRNIRSERGWRARKVDGLSERGDRRARKVEGLSERGDRWIQRRNVGEAGERGRRQQGKLELGINQEYRKHRHRGTIIAFSVIRLKRKRQRFETWDEWTRVFV